MKYLKLFESVGCSEEDTEKVFKPYINWDMISDLKELSLDYLDDGFILRIRVKYETPKTLASLLADHVYLLDFKQSALTSRFSVPNHNVYNLEPIDKRFINYYIFIPMLDKQKVKNIVEILSEMYPEIKDNLFLSYEWKIASTLRCIQKKISTSAKYNPLKFII